jgi:hypothetical protein
MMLEVKAGKQSLSSSSWYVPVGALLLASITCHASQPSLIFCLRLDCGSITKAGLEWSLALMPCTMLVASRLLYFLFIVATGGWVALVVLVAAVPPAPGASVGGVADQRGFAMEL